MTTSVQDLRDFISQRLTAAAAEIFSVFEQTVVRYEEEIDRQRRLLEITWKPGIKSPTAERPHHPGSEEREESLQVKEEEEEEAAPSHIKEELEELECHQIPEGHQGLDVVLEPEASAFLASLGDRPGNQNWKRNGHEDSRSTRNTELKVSVRHPSGGVNRSQKWFDGETHKKSITCDICGKAFKFSSQVQLHRRIHTGEKPHSCQICGKRFVQKQHLKNHTKIHTGEKPYSCEVCGKSFSDQGNFLVHMRTHTGEKPFSCPVCGKRFIQKQHLKKHSIIHTASCSIPCPGHQTIGVGRDRL